MIDPIEIPTPVDVPLYTFRVTLDGVEYLFKLDWNDRENRWYLGLYTADEIPLAVGIKVVANWPLLRRFTGTNMPPGILIAADMSAERGESPEYADLGTRVKLLYHPVNA